MPIHCRKGYDCFDLPSVLRSKISPCNSVPIRRLHVRCRVFHVGHRWLESTESTESTMAMSLPLLPLLPLLHQIYHALRQHLGHFYVPYLLAVALRQLLWKQSEISGISGISGRGAPRHMNLMWSQCELHWAERSHEVDEVQSGKSSSTGQRWSKDGYSSGYSCSFC